MRSNGVTSFCRFWAIDTGTVHTYDCGQANYTTIYFKVQTLLVGDSYKLVPYDCGTQPGWEPSNCILQNESEDAYDSSFGYAATETDYAFGSECLTRLTGSLTNSINYLDIKGESSYGSSGWGTQSLTEHKAKCAHYQSVQGGNSEFFTWDDRN
jgi:hypothetical protein